MEENVTQTSLVPEETQQYFREKAFINMMKKLNFEYDEYRECFKHKSGYSGQISRFDAMLLIHTFVAKKINLDDVDADAERMIKIKEKEMEDEEQWRKKNGISKSKR